MMYRKYRRGDLPDIEIKHSELIRPLQALAQVYHTPSPTLPSPPSPPLPPLPSPYIISSPLQRDSYLARCLFSSLFAAVFSLADLQLTEEEATATKTAVGEGLNFVLETSELFHPPFVASLEDICFLVPQLALAPPTISMASLTAMQEPMGTACVYAPAVVGRLCVCVLVSGCIFKCMRACIRACIHACVWMCVCVCACMRAYVRHCL